MSRSKLVLLVNGITLLLVLGCGVNYPQNSTSGSMVTSTQREEVKHNVTKATQGDWILEAWTDASMTSGASPITVGLRLTRERGNSVSDIALPVRISMERKSDHEEILVRDIRPRFWIKERNSSDSVPVYSNSGGIGKTCLQPGRGLETEMWDVFDFRREPKMLQLGDYLLNIKVMVSSEMEIDLSGLPMEVGRGNK